MYKIFKNGPCVGYVVEVPEEIYNLLPGELRTESFSAEGEKCFFLFCGEELVEL